MVFKTEYKHLKAYTNEELIDILNNNREIDARDLAVYCSEILRRMNEIKPLLNDEK